MGQASIYYPSARLRVRKGIFGCEYASIYLFVYI